MCTSVLFFFLPSHHLPLPSSDKAPPPLIIEHSSLEHILFYGRELQSMYSTLPPSREKEQLKSLLQDTFSLLAYTDPSTSPVRYLLDPAQREPVCVAVNSAILGKNSVRCPVFISSLILLLFFFKHAESKNLPGQPPLEFALGQAVQCLRLMAKSGLGAAAFTGVQDITRSPS